MLIKKISDASGLMTTAVLNAKIGEVENKIPDVSGLVRKTDYNAKIKHIETKILVLLIIINLQMKHLMQR